MSRADCRRRSRSPRPTRQPRSAGGGARHSHLSPLSFDGCARRRDRRRGEERACDRRRNRGRAQARRKRGGGADDARLRRVDAVRQGVRRPAGDADWAIRPRRSHLDVLDPPVAQFLVRGRDRRGRIACGRGERRSCGGRVHRDGVGGDGNRGGRGHADRERGRCGARRTAQRRRSDGRPAARPFKAEV